MLTASLGHLEAQGARILHGIYRIPWDGILGLVNLLGRTCTYKVRVSLTGRRPTTTVLHLDTCPVMLPLPSFVALRLATLEYRKQY